MTIAFSAALALIGAAALLPVSAQAQAPQSQQPMHHISVSRNVMTSTPLAVTVSRSQAAEPPMALHDAIPPAGYVAPATQGPVGTSEVTLHPAAAPTGSPVGELEADFR